MPLSLSFPVSATVRARRRAVDAGAPAGRVDFPVRYGLLLHPTQGPVLIDTGYTHELWHLPGAQAAAYRLLLSPRLAANGDTETVLRRAGLRPDDVRHVVVTHLHPDHVSGLARFTRARIHASRATLALWADRPRLMEGIHGLLRGLLPDIGSLDVAPVDDGRPVALPWGGTGRDVLGDGTIIAVSLPGHMVGHVGLLFPEREEPVLYAVDAAWTQSGYRQGRLPPLPLRLSLDDARSARDSMEVVRRAEARGVTVVLCHDPVPLRAGL